MSKKPRFWRVGAWLHENLRWKHRSEGRVNLIPARVKSWFCDSFDYMLMGLPYGDE